MTVAIPVFQRPFSNFGIGSVVLSRDQLVDIVYEGYLAPEGENYWSIMWDGTKPNSKDTIRARGEVEVFFYISDHIDDKAEFVVTENGTILSMAPLKLEHLCSISILDGGLTVETLTLDNDDLVMVRTMFTQDAEGRIPWQQIVTGEQGRCLSPWRAPEFQPVDE